MDPGEFEEVHVAIKGEQKVEKKGGFEELWPESVEILDIYSNSWWV